MLLMALHLPGLVNHLFNQTSFYCNPFYLKTMNIASFTFRTLVLAFTLAISLSETHAADVPASGSSSVTMCSGSVYDMGGEYYGLTPDADGSLTIYPATSGNKVVLKLVMIEIGWANDKVSIYNGTSASGTPVGTIDQGMGESQVERQVEYYGNNPDGAITVKFETGSWPSESDEGFEFKVNCVNPAELTEMPHNGSKTIQTCDGYLTDNGGPFGRYAAASDDEILILPDEPDKRIELTFEKIHLDGSNDAGITIFNGGWTNFPENTFITTYLGGYHIEEERLVARRPDGSFAVGFSSNDQETPGQGFRARISCVSDPTSAETVIPKNGNESINTCGDTIYDNGTSYGSYMANSDGSLTIHPSVEGQAVTLSFSEFDIEETNDVLSVYDGEDETADLVGEFSGNDLPDTLKSSSSTGALTLHFASNGTNEHDGFAIHSGCEPSEETAIDTIPARVPYSESTTITSCDTFISDHAGAEFYDNNADGSLTILPENQDEQKIMITFSEFNVESNYDFLNVYSGQSTSDGELIESLSGLSLPDTIESDENNGALTLNFTSDRSFTRPGFLARATCVSTIIDTSIVHMSQNDDTSINTCAARILDDGGLDDDYSENNTSTLTIFPNEEHSMVNLSFESFATENSYDYLYIYDGPSTESDLLGIYTGFGLPSDNVASNPDGALTLEFTSDAVVTKSGFSALATCSSPVTDINETLATKTTSLYPNPNNGTFHLKPNPEQQITDVTIYDNSGTIVHKHQINNNESTTINTDLTPGLYVVEYINSDHKTFREKLIIK